MVSLLASGARGPRFNPRPGQGKFECQKHAFLNVRCRDATVGSSCKPNLLKYVHLLMGPVKRICVFEYSVMTNFNYACPAIQRGQGSGFLSEGSS